MRIDLGAFLFLAKRSFWIDLWRKLNQDDCWGRAAQATYFFLLAFFPFLIFLSALVGFVPFRSDLIGRMLAALDRFLPLHTYQLVRGIVLELVRSEDTGVLGLGIVLALWASSVGFSGIIGALNRAYVTRETRSYLKIQGLSIVVTLAVSVFVVISQILIFFGGWLTKLVLTKLHLGTYYSLVSLRWILIFVFLNIGIQIIYFALPNHRLPWRLISPGGLAATLGWIFGSMGFTLYVNHVANYQKLYGSLGTFIVLMVWFYLSSLFLLFGGEIDSAVMRLRRETERVKF